MCHALRFASLQVLHLCRLVLATHSIQRDLTGGIESLHLSKARIDEPSSQHRAFGANGETVARLVAGGKDQRVLWGPGFKFLARPGPTAPWPPGRARPGSVEPVPDSMVLS